MSNSMMWLAIIAALKLAAIGHIWENRCGYLEGSDTGLPAWVGYLLTVGALGCAFFAGRYSL